MAKVAWPTVILGSFVGVAYIATVAMALTGLLPLWLAVPIVAVLTYASYTVAHESVHGSISGNHGSLRWLNKALGYMAAWILMIPLTAHRHEHMAHHRHANDPVHDPDFPVAKMQNSLPAAARAAVEITVGQFSHYFKHRWKKAPVKQNLAMCLEVAAAIIPRLAVVVSGYWVEGLVLFVLAWLVGVVVLLYLFAYIVHRPHERMGRYADTSTILLPGVLGTLLTWLWLFQGCSRTTIPSITCFRACRSTTTRSFTKKSRRSWWQRARLSIVSRRAVWSRYPLVWLPSPFFPVTVRAVLTEAFCRRPTNLGA
jgi:beta-carotene hydroxylase